MKELSHYKIVFFRRTILSNKGPNGGMLIMITGILEGTNTSNHFFKCNFQSSYLQLFILLKKTRRFLVAQI